MNGGTPFAEARGSDASACDFGKPKAKGWCVKGHSASCDHLCAMWCCKHEHQQALLAPRPNDGTQRPGSPDVSLATETRKPGSLK